MHSGVRSCEEKSIWMDVGPFVYTSCGSKGPGVSRVTIDGHSRESMQKITTHCNYLARTQCNIQESTLLLHSGLAEPYASEHAGLWLHWPQHP